MEAILENNRSQLCARRRHIENTKYHCGKKQLQNCQNKNQVKLSYDFPFISYVFPMISLLFLTFFPMDRRFLVSQWRQAWQISRTTSWPYSLCRFAFRCGWGASGMGFDQWLEKGTQSTSFNIAFKSYIGRWFVRWSSYPNLDIYIYTYI